MTGRLTVEHQHLAAAPTTLTARRPPLDVHRVLSDLVVPPHFSKVTFANYHPDSNYPSQDRALTQVEEFAAQVSKTHRRRRARPAKSIYLDGGFGVGKTHLLASLAQAVGTSAAYGTFVEYTHLVGALGFAATVEELSRYRLVAIDEFELDDPGDTVLMARLLRELSDAGVVFAATSNTLPGSLGLGRFAAADFRREIQAMADRFDIITIDGVDYRHRDGQQAPRWADEEECQRRAHVPGAAVDDFDALLNHLAGVAPSRFGALLDGVTGVIWRDVHTISDHAAALRLVVLVDRLYDREIPVRLLGQPGDGIFTDELLASGYRKKYYRALSRLTALTLATDE